MVQVQLLYLSKEVKAGLSTQGGEGEVGMGGRRREGGGGGGQAC